MPAKKKAIEKRSNKTTHSEEQSDFLPMDENKSLNAYEEARLANIARNSQFLSKLDITTTRDTLVALTSAQQKSFKKSEKRAREAPPVPGGWSIRTRGRDVDLTKDPPGAFVVESEQERMAPTGPVSIREEGTPEVLTFADRLQKLPSSVGAAFTASKTNMNYRLLTLGAGTRCTLARRAPRVKVVKERIFSMSFHPLAPLLVTGDKWGQIGFLDLGQESEKDRIFTFNPHSRPVNGLTHTSDGHKLFSCSYDGTIRCFDYTSGVFENLSMGPKKEEEAADMLINLCLSCDQNRIFVAGSAGDVYVLDPRAAGSAAQVLDLHDRKVSSVDSHPNDSNVLVTASNDHTVKIWDTRKVSKAKPLHLLQQSRAVTSAYICPSGPLSLVTTCYDDTVRFWRPEDKANPVITVKHDNQTGRFVTNFRAVWDPKSSVVLIGNMKKKVDILDGQGREIASISHEHCTTIPAVNVAHPTLALMASGGGSGYVNVWAPA